MKFLRYLTKSRFKLAAECPTKLFYTGKPQLYRNIKQEDSFLAMLADGAIRWASWPSVSIPLALKFVPPKMQKPGRKP
jgi:hypothetical protein